MTWVRIDDGFFRNRKVVGLSNNAKILFIAGLCDANDQLTDGFIDKAAAKALTRALSVTGKAVTELVEAGLWHKSEAGYEIHDYLEYQTPASQVRAERAKAKERMQRVRARRRSGGSSGEQHPEHVGMFGRSSPSPNPSPNPNPTDVVTIPDNSRGAAPEPGMATSSNGDQPPDTVEQLATRLASVCTGKRRATVHRRARQVVGWALEHLDERLVDECIGRAAEQQPPPVMPDYAAVVIEQRAGEAGIRIPPYDPGKQP